MEAASILKIRKILVPLDFPNPSIRVILQAATLARQFHSEILILHVLTPQSIDTGVPTDPARFAQWDGIESIVNPSRRPVGSLLQKELDGLPIRAILGTGEAAPAIMAVAAKETADIIMMSSFGQTFSQFLLGSVTAKVLNAAECPVWTDAHVQGLAPQSFKIQNVLCAVDFSRRNRLAVSYAQELASAFSARLTLAHVTPSVELWGPGGDYVNEEWKKTVVAAASQHLADLNRELGNSAGVFVGSGDVPKVLSEAAVQTGADVLVTGCLPIGGRLRTYGYAIISAVPIPVLNF